MAINFEKMARIEAQTEAANAASRSLFDVYRARMEEASRERCDAVARAHAVQHLSLARLNELDAETLDAAGVNVTALRRATMAATLAGEIKARMDVERAAVDDMNRLMHALRRYSADGLVFGD